jgi:uncharacterized protein (TIGR02001 family)
MKTKSINILLFFLIFFSHEDSALAKPIKLSEDMELSFNGGYMSRYVYRGLDQNKDRSTAYVGADLSLPMGVYIGTWAAEVNQATATEEIDIYFGIHQSVKDFNFDISYLEARYPGERQSLNAAEYNFKINYQPQMKPFSFGYYLAIEDTGNAVGSDYKEFNIAYDFKLFNFFTSYGDWDAINKVKTFEISKSFSLFDLSISRIMTDNVGATADETFNIITLSKNF